MKKNLFMTTFGQQLELEKKARITVPTLVKYLPRILLSDTDARTVLTVPIPVTNPITTLYKKFTTQLDRELRYFTVMDMSQLSEVPDLFIMKEAEVDGSVLNAPAMVQQLRHLWVDVAPYTQRIRGTTQQKVTDSTGLAGTFVRGLLSMTYRDNDTWLNPVLSSYLVETYSMAITSAINSVVKLDPNEEFITRVIFALLYAQLLSPDNSELRFPPLLRRAEYLGSFQDVSELLDRFDEHRPNQGESPMSLELIATILPKFASTDKLRGLNTYNLLSWTGKNLQDRLTMHFAMDYPPFFLYMILRVLSNYTKNYHLMYALKADVRKARAFVENIQNGNVFTGRIKQ